MSHLVIIVLSNQSLTGFSITFFNYYLNFECIYIFCRNIVVTSGKKKNPKYVIFIVITSIYRVLSVNEYTPLKSKVLNNISMNTKTFSKMLTRLSLI